MKIRVSSNNLILLLLSVLLPGVLQAQFLLDMIDTTHSEEKGLYAIFKKTDHLQISGYFQPQLQFVQSKGANTYSGGDFATYANNRFMMRRGRIRFDYAHYNEEGLPQAQVVFQFDGTERGVVIRDFWARGFENKFQLFSFTAGMFARPFGFEVNLSSGDRETPERGRMSQILMKTERDLGMMGSFEPRKKTNPLRLIKFDIGVFNGQGLDGPVDYDSYKDIISRVSLKPMTIAKNLSVSAGASLLQGGFVQNSRYIYNMSGINGSKTFVVDSSITNIGGKAPRKYRGLDAQVRLNNSFGRTELRGEYWWGTQTASANESATPGTLLNEPYFIRNFDGAFVYLLQNIGDSKHQIVFKYDFYDPNVDIDGKKIGEPGNNTHSGDIKFHTFGTGFQYYFNRNTKLVLWYDIVRNEQTRLDNYDNDIKDNVLTCRLQFRF